MHSHKDLYIDKMFVSSIISRHVNILRQYVFQLILELLRVTLQMMTNDVAILLYSIVYFNPWISLTNNLSMLMISRSLRQRITGICVNSRYTY